MPLQGRVHDIQQLHRKKTGWKVEQLYIHTYVYIYIYIIFEENRLVQKHATFVMGMKLNIYLNE